jgi:hypothetical protein
MSAATRKTEKRDGSRRPDDFEYEFPQHSLLFDDGRILRNLT